MFSACRPRGGLSVSLLSSAGRLAGPKQRLCVNRAQRRCETRAARLSVLRLEIKVGETLQEAG